MAVAISVNAASITNTVDHIVNVRGADAPIISYSPITASNMFLFGSGTSPSNVVTFSQLSGSTNTLSGVFVPTNRIISTFAPLTGGGALDANRSLGFDGSFSYNGAGITNYPASTMTGTIAFPRLPVGTLTNLVGGTGITSSYSAGVYTVSSSGGLSTTFTSSDQTITGGSILTLPHGLSGAPRAIFVYIRCTSADQGYSIGNVLLMHSGSDPFNNAGCTVQVDATNIYVILGALVPNLFYAHNRATFLTSSLDSTKWNLFVVAYF